MNGFVLRAGHFLSHPFGFHPFGPDAGPHVSAPVAAGPKPATTPRPGAVGDLSWISLCRDGTATPDPRADQARLSLQSERPEGPREDLFRMGL